MSSKKAMKLAQKQAFAKHRSNITNSRFGSKKLDLSNKVNSKKKIKIPNFLLKIFLLFYRKIFLKALLHH